MKLLLTAMVALLALTFALPSMALQRQPAASANYVLDSKVAGVYRPAFGEGALTLFKRHENKLYAVQGDSAGSFTVDAVHSNRSADEAVVHLLGPNGDLTTLDSSFGRVEMTFSDGSVLHLRRVRGLTNHDEVKLETFMPVTRSVGLDLDCEYVNTSVERAICENSSLNEMNTAMTAGYQALLGYAAGPEETKFLNGQQAQWIAKRNRCETMKCLEESYDRRLSEMGDMINYLRNPKNREQ